MIPGGGGTGSSKLTNPSFGFMGAVGPLITEQCEVKCEGELNRNIRDQSTGGLGEVFNDMFSLLNIFGQRLGQQYIQGSVYHCLSVVFPPLNLLLPISEKKKRFCLNDQ